MDSVKQAFSRISIRRIRGILWQELFVTLRSAEVFADIFVFPFANVIIFGFISVYLSTQNPIAGRMVLLGMLLWQIIWIVQYSVTVGSLWNIWSRNLTNLFMTPLRLEEYIIAHTLSGIVKAVLVLLVSALLSSFAFHFNVFEMGFGALVLVMLNFILFAYALGVALLGIIFRYGTRVQAAAWAAVTFIQPLVAAFYPVEVLPGVFRAFAYLMPATHAFEAARYALMNGGTIAWGSFGIAFLENIVYVVLCSMLFVYMYNTSRDTGQFARNET